MFLLYNASNMCVGEEEEEKSHLSVGMNRRSFLTMKTKRERKRALTTLLTMFLKISPFSG